MKELVLGLCLIVERVAAQRPCTMEAKVCPDGSTVGRSGPNCEFTPCPSSYSPAYPRYPGGGACTLEAKVCPDGSTVGRVPPFCQFAPCPGGGGGGFCTADAKICPDGSTVGRVPPSCEFAPCTGTGVGGVCTLELRTCPDGSTVGRVPPSCQFAPCLGGGQVACTADAKVCPDGTTVGRVPPSCEFAPCPGFGGGGGGLFPNYCLSNNDCGPARCCRNGGTYGFGTCGPQGQFGDTCSPFGCGCASGLTCSGGYLGQGTCVYSGGGGGGGTGCGYCPFGTTCKSTGIVCIRYPCPQSWQCVPDYPNDGGGVSGCWQCPLNTRCEPVNIYCITYPCPQQYKCVPYDFGSQVCGLNEEYTSCGSSSCWEEKCGQGPLPNICTADCKSGCRCKKGFKRNYDGRCSATCYIVGRPFSSEKGYLISSVIPLSRPELNVSSSETVTLLADEQQALAASHWSRIALMEHASVASFARFSMQLMSVGAPLPLLHAAHQAALDEVKHAQIAISFANKFGKTNIVLGDFPLSGAHFEFGNVSDIAQATALEGCIEETISALVTKMQAEGMTDPVMRAALREVAEEEVSHAVLAWRSVKWMLEKSPAIRSSVTDVFSTQPRPEHITSTPARSALEDAGILPVEKMDKLREIGWFNIVAPTATSLGLLDAYTEASEEMNEATRIRAVIAHALE